MRGLEGRGVRHVVCIPRKVRTPQGRPLGKALRALGCEAHKPRGGDPWVRPQKPDRLRLMTRARVKGWGKSPPSTWVTGSGLADPRPEQGQVGRRLRVARPMPPGRPRRWMALHDRIRLMALSLSMSIIFILMEIECIIVGSFGESHWGCTRA